jgi:hypothetical protein
MEDSPARTDAARRPKVRKNGDGLMAHGPAVVSANAFIGATQYRIAAGDIV